MLCTFERAAFATDCPTLDATFPAASLTESVTVCMNPLVLISESELEAMASDEATRTKNEQLISDGLAQMPGLKKQLEESGVEVKSFGMEFNDDGTLSYFAVLDKSAEAQKERIENIREEKKAEAEKAREPQKKENLTTITASSMDELIKKIKDTMYEAKADNILTEQEKMVGQHFDLKF